MAYGTGRSSYGCLYTAQRSADSVRLLPFTAGSRFRLTTGARRACVDVIFDSDSLLKVGTPKRKRKAIAFEPFKITYD